MEPAEIVRLRQEAGIGKSEATRLWGLRDTRAWRRWETGEKPISGPAARLLLVVHRFPEALALLRETLATANGPDLTGYEEV